jgi:hypothetical protein
VAFIAREISAVCAHFRQERAVLRRPYPMLPPSGIGLFEVFGDDPEASKTEVAECAEMARPMSRGYQLLGEVGFLYLIPALRV